MSKLIRNTSEKVISKKIKIHEEIPGHNAFAFLFVQSTS
jgi:hypothetical protein